MSAADRQARARHRRKAGVAVIRLEIHPVDTADMLVAAGFLAGWDADDPAAIQAAVQAAWDDLTFVPDE